MPWTLIDAALRGMVLAITLLMAALLLRRHSPPAAATTPAARAALLLCLGLAVQALGSTPFVEQQLRCSLQSPLVGVAVGNAVLFWLFSAALFDDDFRWQPWHLLAWALAAGVGAVQCPLFVGGEDLAGMRAVLRAALRLIPALCAVAALWSALRHWGADLVESRRRLRLLLVGAGAVYTAVQLAARLSTPVGLLSPGLALLDMAVLLVVVGSWALALLQLAPGGLLLPAAGLPRRSAANGPASAQAGAPAARPVAAAPSDDAAPGAPVDQALAGALQQAMSVDRAYRDPGLSLAALAARLAVPEYRLRRHINQRLGFRNFNAYVNAFRLDDARRWLADPAQRDAPVLTLALDAGFGSIGPFNRAFKADTGLTPTEFRARALADSSNS
jgi:AraC-like DNA-binding protein